MKQAFRVSVIMPVYNAAQYVPDSVASVLKISDVGELILVEDGSTDTSYEVCLALSKLDPRIRILRHHGGVNRGAGESRNLGVREAKFPYISFLDSDDYYFDNRYVSAKAILENDLSIDAVYEIVLRVNQDTKEEKPFGIKKFVDAKDLFRYILRGGYFHTNAITVRKAFILEIGPFDQVCWPHEDVELWLRMAFGGRLVWGGEAPVATYRIHNANNGVAAFSCKTRRQLWKSVYQRFFWKKIGIANRLIILKQIVRYKFIRLRSNGI